MEWDRIAVLTTTMDRHSLSGAACAMENKPTGIRLKIPGPGDVAIEQGDADVIHVLVHLAAQLHKLSHSLHLKEQGRNFHSGFYTFIGDQEMDWIWMILLEALLGIWILNH
jgi:hypothetical protein